MERYKNLHSWMIVPFIIVQVSIFSYYWPKFTTQSWEIHFHYWLVSFWYLLLIVQPYLISKGKILNHRTLGIVGFLLAGGVLFTGLNILDIPLRLADSFNPNKPGPPVSFYYGTLIIEFVSILAFGYAVIKSIIHRKNVKEHSWWLIASVFYMMSPALGRGMILFWRKILPPENFKPFYAFASSELIYLILLLLFASKFGKFKHQATIIGIVLIFIRLLRVPMGSSETIQEFLRAVIKY
ncbi:MAG: hypothetical protein HKO81_00745 [Flavobacteriaceae bacterium]|nr:hypothetical protein [Winogradskyella sp.]NNL15151.1 hypothetical protein [Flavobacteriaceae bacterium]